MKSLTDNELMAALRESPPLPHDTDPMGAFLRIHGVLDPLSADQRYRVLRAICVLLDIPITL